MRHLSSIPSQCMNNSIAIFMSNIPCNDIEYPDIKELFEDHLDEFVSELARKNPLRSVFVWFSEEEGSPGPCSKLLGYNFSMTDDHVSLVTSSNYSYFMKGDGGGPCLTPSFDEKGDNDASSSSSMGTGVKVAIIVGCSIALVVIVIIVGICAFRIRRRYFKSKIEYFASIHQSRKKRSLDGETGDEDWEIAPKELKLDSAHVLGRGVSAIVYKGRLKKKRDGQVVEVDVAVKFSHVYATQASRDSMLQEIEFMKQLGNHKNLVSIIGYVRRVDNPVIATEFCAKGDLLRVLRNHQIHFMSEERCSIVEICLILPDLLRIATEACRGLIHLSSLDIVHRDIAARNVLLTSDLTAKIGDFGLCRRVDDTESPQTSGKLPIRNMPFESLKFGRFSEKSDVWSFGIMIWEMFTGGQTVLKEIEIEDLVDYLSKGNRPVFPSNVPEEIVNSVNDSCLQREEAERSSFKEIGEKLEAFLTYKFDVPHSSN